jgi:hypothetical protein
MKLIENFEDLVNKLAASKVIMIVFVDPSTLTPS